MSVIAHSTMTARAAVATPAGGQLYVRLAVACMAVAVVGFAPTYWLPLLRGTLNVSAMMHDRNPSILRLRLRQVDVGRLLDEGH